MAAAAAVGLVSECHGSYALRMVAVKLVSSALSLCKSDVIETSTRPDYDWLQIDNAEFV